VASCGLLSPDTVNVDRLRFRDWAGIKLMVYFCQEVIAGSWFGSVFGCLFVPGHKFVVKFPTRIDCFVDSIVRFV